MKLYHQQKITGGPDYGESKIETFDVMDKINGLTGLKA